MSLRTELDKFYTKKEVVEKCIELFKKHINIKNTDLIIEPSAGNGSFIEFITKFNCNYAFYDIEPEHELVLKQNFLTLDTSNLSSVHLLGNPPFGRQSSLAIKFIKKCCKFADSISFILPRSFKKQSMKKHFSLNFHLEEEIDLDKNSFLINSTSVDVPCIFQIWKKKDYPRQSFLKLEPDGFNFVRKTDNPDISFRRVGSKASEISTDTEQKNIQSHYFLKFDDNTEISKIVDCISCLKFDDNNTVGPRSISKQEVIAKFNPVLKRKTL